MPAESLSPEAGTRLSDDLRHLLHVAGGQPMRIGEMVDNLRGRGLQVMVVLLCLPFLSPVTLPGVSIPFGLAIALCGLRIAFGRKPWLPKAILRRTVPYGVLEKMVRAGCAIYGKLEKIVRPRLSVLLAGPGMVQTIGAAIALAGVLLSLPIPPPFILTNTIPGFAIIFLSLGLMERDGVMIVIGYALSLVGTLYVALIIFAGTAGIEQLWRMVAEK